MNLEELAETIQNMIVQHDYPGCEARSLNLGLPEAAVKSPARVFGQALQHTNIYVQLTALRWFQERSSVARNYIESFVKLLSSEDEWVKFEAIKTLERVDSDGDAVVLDIAALLKDSSQMIRQEAAKACGKIAVNSKNPIVITSLREAALDPEEKVRFKAQKALRKLGAYTT